MAALLSHSATAALVTLEFPTYKAPSLGGPPWAVRPAFYVALLATPGRQISYGEDCVVEGLEDEDKVEVAPGGLRRYAHFRPARTFEISGGTDWIGVWRHV